MGGAAALEHVAVTPRELPARKFTTTTTIPERDGDAEKNRKYRIPDGPGGLVRDNAASAKFAQLLLRPRLGRLRQHFRPTRLGREDLIVLLRIEKMYNTFSVEGI